MLPTRIALVPYGVTVDQEDFLNVAAALQTQATRDIAPIWGVQGVVSPFLRLEAVPPGYFPLALVRDVEPAHGYHRAKRGLPIGVVKYGDGWSVLASHEMTEMLVDPWGHLSTSGWSPEDGWVEYLVEVCDPCESVFYLIGDVWVSDFVTPEYYDPASTETNRYSFTGKVRAPLDVITDGYVSWTTADGSISQKDATAAVHRISAPEAVPPREWVDQKSAAGAPDTASVARLRSRSQEPYGTGGAQYFMRLKQDLDLLLAQVDHPATSTAVPPVVPGPGGGPAALPESQAERVLALLHAMADPRKDTYAHFKVDPEQVEEDFGIQPQGIDLRQLAGQLPDPEHFAAVVQISRAGKGLNDPHFANFLITHGAFGGA